MNVWLYMTANIITVATLIVSASVAVGRMCQILSSLSDQMVQMRADFKAHQEHDQATFDVFHATLLQLVIRQGERVSVAPVAERLIEPPVITKEV